MTVQTKMKKALLFNYQIPGFLQGRYAEMLVARAVRFYIENDLDSLVAGEDLIPFCGKCGDEQLKGVRKSDCHKATIGYDNLDHSEEIEHKFHP